VVEGRRQKRRPGPIGAATSLSLSLSTSPNLPSAFFFFFHSRSVKAAQRDRAAYLARHDPLDADDPVTAEIAGRLATRLDECGGRGPFPRVLILGGGVATGALLARLAGGRGGVEAATVIEASAGMCDRLARRAAAAGATGAAWPALTIIHGDEEAAAGPAAAALDAGPAAPYDAALAPLGLHWVNDLPGLLTRVRRALRPDAPFLGVMWGGDTLHELRAALTLAEARGGGASPRVSPMVRVRDAGSLLVRAGFALPAVDADEVRAVFPDPAALVAHLRRAGETNAARGRRPALLPRSVGPDALATYASRFGVDPAEEAAAEAADRRGGGGGGEGSSGSPSAPPATASPSLVVPATFEALFLTGWSPAPSQAAAAPRGSATVSLAQLAEELDKKKKEEE
jgi:NADH dehydrogenase [ubiquinone] 1 alpha subcomplex assembly factor 5